MASPLDCHSQERQLVTFEPEGLVYLTPAFSHVFVTPGLRPRGGFSGDSSRCRKAPAGEHFRGLGLRDGDRRCFFSGGVL